MINQPLKRVKVAPSLLANTDKIRMAKAAALVSSDTKYSEFAPNLCSRDEVLEQVSLHSCIERLLCPAY